MASRLRHRGPDDSGFYESPVERVGLAHRRLSIIDLSPAAHQPLPNEDRTIWLTFNGEIYNYRELDGELKAKGHTYRSQSDSETIVHAYEEWGHDCVQRFNGMFAFAIWDERRRELFCARDRFGEKPFYYVAREGTFAFASEIKALFVDPSIPRAPDRRTLARYLAHGLADVDDRTFFEGIRTLRPGHRLVLREARADISPYWTLPERESHETVPEADWERIFLDLLTDSVRLRLRSDVPLGTCLSGGLDSSSIVALTSRLEGREISTFSVLYDEPGLAERSFVDAVTRAYPTRAFDVVPDGRDFLETLSSIVWHHDEPAASPGQYSQWHVMRLARQHGVTVLLNGQGGDEILAGYARHVTTDARERLLRWDLVGAVRGLRGEVRIRGGSPLAGLKRVIYPIAPRSATARYRRYVTSTLCALDYLAPGLAGEAGLFEEGFRSLREHLEADLTRLSVPSLVHAEDRCSMAFSREIRLPFLDHRLVELLFAMPSHMKIRGGLTKHVLRQVMRRGGLPDRVASRRDKKGYPTPVDRWLRTTARAQALDLLMSASLRNRGLIDTGRVLQAFEEHLRGLADHTLLLWRWINTELWFRRFIDDECGVLRASNGCAEGAAEPAPEGPSTTGGGTGQVRGGCLVRSLPDSATPPRETAVGAPPAARNNEVDGPWPVRTGRDPARDETRPTSRSHVGYILEPPYPTFVINEIVAARHLGQRITILNSFRPFEQREPSAEQARQESHYFPPCYEGVTGSVLGLLADSPVRWSRAVAAVARHRLHPRLLLLAAHYARLARTSGITHFHGMYGTTPATVALLASRLAGTTFSFTCHAYDIFLPNPLLPWKLRHARFMTTVSAFNKRYIETHYRVADPSRIRVVYLGVDHHKWTPRSTAPAEPPIVLCVANLVPFKGHEHLIRASARLRAGGLDHRVALVGDGPERPALEALTKALDLAGTVSLLGAQTQASVRRWLERAAVFVLASVVDTKGSRDGIPVALMEAMASGVPVVSTRVAGIPELIRDGQSGLLVDEQDVEALAAAIRRVLEDPQQRAALEQGGRERIDSCFNLERSASEMLGLFDGVTAPV